MVLKEIDLTQKSKMPAQKGEPEQYDIFGLSEWSEGKTGFGDEEAKFKHQRLVYKTSSIESSNMELNVKAS